MITSFRCSDTAAIFRGETPKRFKAIATAAERKLLLVDKAFHLADLRVPPGNRLEPLKGNRTGQHSIRINDQWRVCFVWTANAVGAGQASNVEIVDYH